MMNEHDIAAALQKAAEREIPDSVNVWPVVAARVPRRERVPAWSPARLAAAGAAVVLLVAVAFGAARLGARPGASVPPTGAVDQPGLASWVAPEVFPDLDTLTAAADLIVRGHATSAAALAIEQVLVNRLAVDPAAVELRLLQVPPDAPPLLNDPPLVPGAEYILFLRSTYGAGSERFRQGDRSFLPVGGPQGQWRIQDGAVVQAAGVPLKVRAGEPVAEFAQAITAAPDLRGMAAALLAEHGWAAGEPDTTRLQSLPSARGLTLDAELQARLAASRDLGLDWAPHAEQPALYLQYVLEPLQYELVPRGLRATVLVADGRAIGAWLRVGDWGLVFSLDQHEEALAALADPGLHPTPTPDPHPLGARPNLAQHYRLSEARDMWVKGARVQGGLVRDDVLRAQLIAALDSEVAVEQLGLGELPPDDVDTVLVVFDRSDGQTVVEGDYIAFRYHTGEGRVYIYERGAAFAPPAAFVEALAPLLGPAPAPAGRPTEAPGAGMAVY